MCAFMYVPSLGMTAANTQKKQNLLIPFTKIVSPLCRMLKKASLVIHLQSGMAHSYL